jgi:hypothetical protein
MTPYSIPRPEPELAPWLTQFGPKFSQYASTLGFSAAEVEQTRREVDYLVYLLNFYLPTLRQTLDAAIAYKNFIKEGDPTAPLPPLPGTQPLPAAPDPVPAGALTRLRKLVQNIKTRPGYTETIGRDLDIVRQGATHYPDAPMLTLASAAAGAVTVDWNKAGWSGVKMQTRQNGVWVDLGMDVRSPFVDTRPLAVPYQPEGREYRACYLDGDTVQPAFSPVLEVIVAP